MQSANSGIYGKRRLLPARRERMIVSGVLLKSQAIQAADIVIMHGNIMKY